MALHRFDVHTTDMALHRFHVHTTEMAVHRFDVHAFGCTASIRFDLEAFGVVSIQRPLGLCPRCFEFGDEG